jgi:hypothetical protein
MAKPKFDFPATLAKLRSTPKGKEASMYGPLRDIFIHVLGYPAADVDIDTAGEGGRPDLTIRAPSGLIDAKGREEKTDWIVVEAKDERGRFARPDSRETIFEKKSKYIGPHTAYFVMAEPEAWVVRPVSGAVLTAEADIEIPLAGIDEPGFRRAAIGLLADQAGVSAQLVRFRSGDETLIGVEKLDSAAPFPTQAMKNRLRLARNRFFQQIREATAHLQTTVAGALARLKPEIDDFKAKGEGFWQEFGENGDQGFDPHALTLYGKPQGPEQSRLHDRKSAALKREFSKSPHIARLALQGLPKFQARTGVEAGKLLELFAIETANLILARVLLLRFLEDHGFFGETRYICNGGVAAFQAMRSYFKSSYAKLLEQAYQEGSRLYATAFEPTELDWIFGVKDETLSNAIEGTLFRFSRYDFTTVKGDILTGIYDRFMDRAQRKKLGEFFTPPSIARYILQRIGIARHSRVLDPACGSGTFLIESYRMMVGRDLERGAAEYSDVLAAMSRIAGNDLNTFSSVLAQIQLLWQILGLKTAIESQGFPDIVVTAKVNSLVERGHWGSLDRFAEIDAPEYDAVIGNPPYIRAERSAQALDARSQQEFERGRGHFPGVSSKLNAFALFLYRALDRWCKPQGADGRAGKLGFILPVSLFDANDCADLRQLLALGGRWAIREIVDLEIIYREVFDADVLPAIIIVENTPPRAEDKVSIRFADRACVKRQAGGALPEFDLAALPEALIPYPDLFSPDGRILPRLTPRRLEILRKLWKNSSFADAAKPYWVRKERGKIVEWVDQEPPDPHRWEARRMIAGGVAFRGAKTERDKGIPVYKGENIVATELQGDPVLENADLDCVDDISLWKYLDIHPQRGLAVAGVAHCPNGILFNPAALAFTNTSTILLPKDELADIPFDLLLLSNIYVWFYALAARMGILRTLRSHIYPTNLALLPWSEALAKAGPAIEALREPLVLACRKRLRAADALETALADLNLPTLKTRIQQDPDASLSWGDNFDSPDYEAPIDTPALTMDGGEWRVRCNADLEDWIEINREGLAEGLLIALGQKLGRALTKSQLFNLPVPVSEDERSAWQAVVAAHGEDALETEMQSRLLALDNRVGFALGLEESDIQEIRRDLAEDAFLRGIRPRYPGTVTRKRGFRAGLDSEQRYV